MGGRRSYLGRGAQSIYALLLAAALTIAVAATTSTTATAQTGGTTWTQVGQDIDGEAADDDFGLERAVAMSADGNTIIVGAEGNDGNGTNSGHARVYQLNGTTWQQIGQDLDGEAAGDRSGFAVAMSADGNTVIIGAPGNDGNGANSGHARVYQLNGTTWQQIGQDLDGEAAGDDSGWDVGMSSNGTTIIIGARLNNGNGTESGHARVFQLNGNAWQQVGQDINGEAAGDRSGEAVAMSNDGKTVVIGAPLNNGNGNISGHVRIFQLNGNAWQQVGQDIDGENAGDISGRAVAMSADGNTVIIGALLNNGNGNESGHARVYRLIGSSWQQVGQDINGENAGDASGWAVAMSADGNTVIIGAPDNDGNGTRSGHARVYQLNGNSWQQVDQDIDGENAFDISGLSVAMSADGNTIIIGAPRNDGNGNGSGHVRAYEPNPICNGFAVTVDLGAGQSPTAGNDVILGTSGADLIVALGGNDTICSLGGNDIINAGPGNDFVDAGDGDDTVFGLDGDDTINTGNGADSIISGNGADTVNGGPENDTINGGPGNDTLLGAADDDTIFGQAGNDTISGNGGDDFIVGADGTDIISGGPGNDILNGGNNDDTVNGGPGNDTLFGLGGDDTLLGAADNDTIFGQLGNDFINGNGGDDELLGNEGNDTLTDPFGTNTINGGAGNDTINGGAGNDQIFGDGNLAQAGDDVINGGPGNDTLIGFAGNDTIISNDGVADVVNGGPHTTGDTCTTDPTDTVFNCP